MSAEVLRAAARLMRKRAEAVVSDDSNAADGWYAHLGGVGTAWVNDRSGHLVSAHGMPKHAEHIASWHPAIALAVADWLEATADARATAITLGMGEPDRALAMARAYLGESA